MPLGSKVADGLFTARVLVETGILRPVRPDKLARIGERYMRLGASPALGISACAIEHPGRTALIDEVGALTFAQLNERSNALASSLRSEGVSEGDGVAIMCRNHRHFVEATIACSRLGANGLFLNTAFAGPQLVDVVARERLAALVYDQEFSGLLEGVGSNLRRYIGWTDGAGGEEPSVDELIGSGDADGPPTPSENSHYVILTSGTTGTPKGAQRGQPEGLAPLAAVLDKIPMRSRQTTVIAAPLFHSWGFTHFLLSLPLSATMVLRRRFDPEETLRDVAQHRARGLAVVPVMMQRMLDLSPEVRGPYNVSSLEVTAASGSALPGELATNWMDEFGDNLYNLYGSTEVAWATIATPGDMRSAPGTAGRAPRGTLVKIVDPEGLAVARGETGRIFVGNSMAFEGYTGGGDKERIDGMLSSGDVGHFDEDGRLFIDGRDDEMIVSGGENVFPREVEDLLADHDAVAEAAAMGVEDEQFGQRLRAFVVVRDDAEVTEEELKSHVKANLARYKVPREVIFLEELPRNATGKVVKRELSDAHESA
ncbi:MAG: acyl-CoA synthetase [Solirubrobacterales bacterium]|nr:acyl-CoA synthetase [Solirubrobacterales bacterium]